jgi:hypothetical protein
VSKAFSTIYSSLYLTYIVSRDSSGGRENRLGAGRPRNWHSIPFGGQETFRLSTASRPASGAHPASYSVITGGGFFHPKVKRLVREADHSLSSGAEVKMHGAKPLLAHTPSCRGANYLY